MACFLTPMAVGIVTTVMRKKVPAKYHIGWLNLMLWGGVIMLGVDHICNKEITFSPPFLTGGFSEVIQEISLVGGAMTISVILLWVVMVGIVARTDRRARYVEA